MRTAFLRLLNTPDKAIVLVAAADSTGGPANLQRFDVNVDAFSAVPNTPFCYWAGPGVLELFTQLPAFDAGSWIAERALSTNDDFRYLRTCWERRGSIVLDRPASGWLPYAKGGEYSTYFSDILLLVNWIDEGREIEADVLRKYPYLNGNAEWVLHRECRYLAPGITWSRRSQVGLSLRVLPAGCVFADKGPSAFFDGEEQGELLGRLAVANSTSFRSLVELQMAFGSFEVGVIQRTPVPDLTPADESALATLARRAWSLKRTLDTRTETSHAFVLPALLQVEGDTLADRVTAWNDHVRKINAELDEIQAEIDGRCFQLYGISDEDRHAITEGFGGGAEAVEDGDGSDEVEAEEDEPAELADAETLATELISWAVGVAFGRFDIRLATGDHELPTEPEPFDPLPACSAAMLTGEDDLPLADAPDGYPIDFPTDGILVDDYGHDRDLVAAVRAVIDEVFGDRADRWWEQITETLDPKGHELRNWFASKFFTHHLKSHSKSRRKAPIVWQLATPSKRYSVWLYAHRLTRDSLFGLQNNIIAPKLEHEERRLNNMFQDAAGSPSARERKEIAAQEDYVSELRAMLEQVKLVAPLWRPELDDGIVLVMAPLWQLAPHHRAWQKELKSKWSELAAGKYDWAHLAMHLWPERVTGKCAEDRSLAIAHDLEDVFWEEDADGKWHQRETSTRPIEELVAQRRSAAVEAALEGLG